MSAFKTALTEFCKEHNIEQQEVFEKIPIFKKMFDEDKSSSEAMFDLVMHLLKENSKLEKENQQQKAEFEKFTSPKCFTNKDAEEIRKHVLNFGEIMDDQIEDVVIGGGIKKRGYTEHDIDLNILLKPVDYPEGIQPLIEKLSKYLKKQNVDSNKLHLHFYSFVDEKLPNEEVKK